MKPLLLASVAMLALSNVARAEYVAQCSFGAKNIALSINDDPNDSSAAISVSDGTVVYGTSVLVGNGNGHLIRENNTATEWYVSPARKHRSYVRLQGEPRPLDCGGFVYTNLGAPQAAPTPAPTYVATNADAPAPTYAPALDRLPVMINHNQAHAAVSLGTLPVIMLVDTGCTNMTVSQGIADRLLASGQATRGENVESTIADGSTHTEASIVINSMTVGGHVLSSVPAAVSPNGAEMLLGFNVLNRVSGKFAINVANSTLDFE
jgi:gag-polyprotein putative aspartyl protease